MSDLEGWKKEILKIPYLIGWRLDLGSDRNVCLEEMACMYERQGFPDRARDLRRHAQKDLDGAEEWKKIYEDRLEYLKKLIEEEEGIAL